MITDGKVLEETQEARAIEFNGVDVAVMILGNKEDGAEEVANLIAAAPKLLAACKGITELFTNCYLPREVCAFKVAEQALALAEPK